MLLRNLLLLALTALPSFAQTQVGTLAATEPTQMAIDTDASGTRWLYVSQHGDIPTSGTMPTNGGVILKYNLTTGSTTPIPITTHGTGDGQFISPDGIAIDPTTHDLFVADRYLSRIQRLHSDGTFVMKFGTPTSGAPDEMHGPCGLALDSSGALYVTEHGDTQQPPFGAGGQHVSKYTFSGTGSSMTATRVWRIGSTGTGNGQFDSTGPYGIVLNGSTLLVADAFNNRVEVFDQATGNYLSQFSLSGGAQPIGLSRDAGGALWISETSNSSPGSYDGGGTLQQVQKFSMDGTYQGVTVTAAPAFHLPFGSVLDPVTNKLYVADYANSRVVIFDMSGAGGSSGSVPQITSSSSATADDVHTFNYQITATNSPTSFAATDALPAGLTLNASTGVISGVPAATATTTTTHLTATNSAGTSSSFALTITVNHPTPPTITAFNFVSHSSGQFEVTFSEPVTGVDLSDFALTQGGNSTGALSSVTQVDASHYDVNFTFYSGAPGSFTLSIPNPSTTGIVGVNSGLAYQGGGYTSAIVAVTPHLEVGAQYAPVVQSFAVDSTSGNTVYFKVQFNVGTWNLQPSNFTVNTVSGNATGTVGVIRSDDTVYSTSFLVPVTFSGSGSISLTMSNATQQTISDGNYNMYVGPDTSTTFTLPDTSTLAPTIAQPQTASGTQYQPFYYQIAADYAASYAIDSSTPLPAGLSLNPTTGEITGVPSVSGSIPVTVNVTNPNGTVSGSVTLDLAAGTPTGSAPTIAASQSTSGTQNQPFNYQVVASGATSYALTGSTPLPAGLSLDSTTGVISGTPSGSGSTTVTVQVTNSTGSNSGNVTIAIAAATPTGSAPTIANQSTSGTQNQAFSYQVVASGATSFSVASGSTLPAGLTMSSAGLITGTPTTTGSTTVVVDATNSYGTTPGNVTITIAAAPPAGSAPTIANQSASGTQNQAFSYQVVASGATSFSVASGSTLPAGLTMSSAGQIAGTPTATGSTTVVVDATNSYGTTPGNVTITIAAAPPAGSAPTIANQSASGTQNQAFNYQVVASGATSFSVASGSALPAGLTMSSSGQITGTPTTTGATTVVVDAANSYGTTPANVTITISATTPPPAAPVVTGGSISVTAGSPLTYTVKATNNPTSFSIIYQPVGVSISNTGVISGTPSATGTYNAKVTATNAGGSGSATITIQVNASTPPPPPPPPLKTQTITFVSPTGTLFVGQTFQLRADASSGLPVTYALVSGPGTVSGDSLLLTGAGSVVVRAAQAGNSTYAGTSTTITVTATKAAQEIDTTPVPPKVHTDVALTLDATSNSGLPITYAVVSGPATVDGDKLTFTGSGTVVLQASQPGNAAYAATTSTITLTANPVPRLVNISSRLKVSANDADGASITGFVVTGDQPKPMLIRAVGPTLKEFGVAAPLGNPTLKLFDASGKVVATNSGWGDDAKVAATAHTLGAFPLTAGSKDAAMLVTLAPGAYTAQVQSATGSGTVLIEVYDASATAAVPTKQLINISTRGTVGTGDDVLVGGFVVSGNEPKKVLVRAVGPALQAFGVKGALSDPILTVHAADGSVVATNDNWGTTATVTGGTATSTAADVTAAESATGAFPLPAGSADAALVLTLQPGQYSAVVTGSGGAKGAAMVEVYEVSSQK